MGEINAKLEDGRLKGFVRVWPGIVGGFFVSSAILGISTAVGPDAKTAYDPTELVVVDFSPQSDTHCRGLRPQDSEKVIASTITCEVVEP